MKKEKPPEFIIENAAKWGIRSPDRAEWFLVDGDYYGRRFALGICTRCSFPHIPLVEYSEEPSKITTFEMLRYDFIIHGVRKSFFVGQCPSCLACYWNRVLV